MPTLLKPGSMLPETTTKMGDTVPDKQTSSFHVMSTMLAALPGGEHETIKKSYNRKSFNLNEVIIQ